MVLLTIGVSQSFDGKQIYMPQSELESRSPLGIYGILVLLQLGSTGQLNAVYYEVGSGALTFAFGRQIAYYRSF